MATRARLSRTERKAQTRDELVVAARSVFLERGYHAATLEAVAAEAGYSTGAVYSTFAGKADLFLAVLDDHLGERARQMEEATAGAASLAEHAELLARQFATRRDPGWRALVIEFWAHAARDPELREAFAARHDVLKNAIAQTLTATLERTGERLTLDAGDIASAAAALANGLTLERLAHPDGMSDELFTTIARGLMTSLAGDGTGS
jgi:AcrR family transcriptional regulator